MPATVAVAAWQGVSSQHDRRLETSGNATAAAANLVEIALSKALYHQSTREHANWFHSEWAVEVS